MANLMTLRRLTRSRLGVPLSDDFYTDSVIDDHINLAVEAIDSEYFWPWAEQVDTVTIDPDNPDFPTPDGYRATRVLYDDQRELHAVAPGDLMRIGNTTGEPRVYCTIGAVVSVRPIVTDSRPLTHYWVKQSPWLAEDQDTPRILDQFSGAIVAKAASLLASREGSQSDVDRHLADYERWVVRMRRDVRRNTAPTRVRVRPGGWI